MAAPSEVGFNVLDHSLCDLRFVLAITVALRRSRGHKRKRSLFCFLLNNRLLWPGYERLCDGWPILWFNPKRHYRVGILPVTVKVWERHNLFFAHNQTALCECRVVDRIPSICLDGRGGANSRPLFLFFTDHFRDPT